MPLLNIYLVITFNVASLPHFGPPPHKPGYAGGNNSSIKSNKII